MDNRRLAISTAIAASRMVCLGLTKRWRVVLWHLLPRWQWNGANRYIGATLVAHERRRNRPDVTGGVSDTHRKCMGAFGQRTWQIDAQSFGRVIK